jgi:hypothetical protein
MQDSPPSCQGGPVASTDEDDRWIRVYFGAPSNLESGVRRRVWTALFAACEVARQQGRLIAVISGAKCPDNRSPPEWVRETLRFDVDGLVEVFGASWGCGFEESVAADEGLVRALVTHGDVTSRMAGSRGAGPLSLVRATQFDELKMAFVDWIEAYGADLERNRLRRNQRGADSRQHRLESLGMWEMLTDVEQRRAALEIHLSQTDADRRLQDDGLYARLGIDDAFKLRRML